MSIPINLAEAWLSSDQKILFRLAGKKPGFARRAANKRGFPWPVHRK